MIELVCQYIRNNKQRLPLGHTLIISAQSPIPVELFHGNEIQREDLCNTHEEADSVIIYLMLHTAMKRKSKSIKVMCADTDVFILLMYAYEKHKLSCTLIMEDPATGRPVCDIKAFAIKNLSRTKQYVLAHVLSGGDSLSQLYGKGKGNKRLLKQYKMMYI